MTAATTGAATAHPTRTIQARAGTLPPAVNEPWRASDEGAGGEGPGHDLQAGGQLVDAG